jgi:hypothetical protein
MDLRLDRLLADLREREPELLAAIDADPLLLKRESGGLVIANAGAELFSPQVPHQLFAKGVVYRRGPYRLVSLPLVKIYNLFERVAETAALVELAAEPGVRVRFLRKLDGSLVQRFQADGRAWLTTRGMIDGAVPPASARGEFDYLRAARAIAAERYPAVLEPRPAWEGITLVFELIHPLAKVVTDYGERTDLVLTAALDRDRLRYLTHDELLALGADTGLTVIDAYEPRGGTLAEQIDDLVALLADTDEEGSVLAFERGGMVIDRVKVKSPAYLKLLRLIAGCTYEATVTLADARPDLADWPAFEGYLRSRGTEECPEELLGVYRQHWERLRTYLDGVERLRAWAAASYAVIMAELGKVAGEDARTRRKRFAAAAVTRRHSALLFAAYSGRLDTAAVRRFCPDVASLEEALRAIGG